MGIATDDCFIRGDSTIRSLFQHLLNTKNISVYRVSEDTGVFKPKIHNYRNFSFKEARAKKKPYPTQRDIVIMFKYLGYKIKPEFINEQLTTSSQG